MSATLVLPRITFTETAPRNGFAVVTACTYDGLNGIQLSQVAMPPLPIDRERNEQWTYEYAGDGLLVRHWDKLPSAFGYVVVVTHTRKLEAALELSQAIAGAATQTTAALGAAPAAAVIGATTAIIKAVQQRMGAKVIGSLVGSEADRNGTHDSWSLARTEGDITFSLAYSVRPGAPS